MHNDPAHPIQPIAEVQTASDGYALHVLVWRPLATPRGRIVVLHGVQSHAGWYHRLGRNLAEAGIEAHFPDRRGSGANQRDRGHAESANRLVQDITERLDDLSRRSPAVPQALAAISWGAKIAAAAAARRPDLVHCVALICPGLIPRVGVTAREGLRITLAFFLRPRAKFPIPLADPALFTANPDAQRFIAQDPYSIREATAKLLAASTVLDRSVRRALPAIRQPALLMIAGQDRIVDNRRTLKAFECVSSDRKQVIEYPEGHHTMEFDPDPDRYARDLIAWLENCWRTGSSVGASNL